MPDSHGTRGRDVDNWHNEASLVRRGLFFDGMSDSLESCDGASQVWKTLGISRIS